MRSEAEIKPLPTNLDRALKREALVQTGAGLGATLLLGWLAQIYFGFPTTQIPVAGLIFAVFIGFVFLRLSEHAPHRHLGTANRITIFRAALVANIAAASLYPSILIAHGLAATAIMIVTLALDGVDGWVARHNAQSSRFGARLDQELDALFTAVLALAIFWMGKAGAWVLLAGGWHYIFHGLRGAFPALRNPLPFSQRRRIICGAVVAALILCASPLLSPQPARLLALTVVMLLSGSFLIDIAWLCRLFGSTRGHQRDSAAQQKSK